MSKEPLEFESDPYSPFIFAINSPLTKAKYVPRLDKFFDFINLKGTIQEKCIAFVEKYKNEPSWLIGTVIKFLQIQKWESQKEGLII
jgi:hypothetical protein